MKQCVICGAEFEPVSRQKYCQDCRRAEGKGKTKAWKEAHKAVPKTVMAVCPICGKEYEKRNGNLMCSAECSRIRTNKMQGDNKKDKNRDKSGMKPKLGIDNKVRAAAKMGLTYADMQRRDSLDRAGKVDVTLGGRI